MVFDVCCSCTNTDLFEMSTYHVFNEEDVCGAIPVHLSEFHGLTVTLDLLLVLLPYGKNFIIRFAWTQ